MTMSPSRPSGYVDRGEFERVQHELQDLRETLRAVLEMRDDGVRKKQLELASVVPLPLPAAPPAAYTPPPPPPALAPVPMPPPPAATAPDANVSLHVHCSPAFRERLRRAVSTGQRSDWIVSVLERELDLIERYRAPQR